MFSPTRPAYRAARSPSKPLRPHVLLMTLPVFLFHGPVDFPFGVPLGHVLAFVIELFAFAQSQLHLHPAALKVEGKGNQGEAFLF